MTHTVLSLWTVYERPADYPAGWVARRFEIRPGTPDPVLTRDSMVGHDLDVIRGYMEMRGLTCVPRNDDDQIDIVESWI